MLVGGLDECGTGSGAGPIVSVLAVFEESAKSKLPRGVKDSKQTTKSQRDLLYQQLLDLAVDVGIGCSWPWEIDSDYVGALQASYSRAIEGINPSNCPDKIIVDGINPVRSWDGVQLVEPKADNNHWQVSAASIIGKVTRDRAMSELSKVWPEYGFDKHFGYVTPVHQESVRRLGLLIDAKNKSKYIHRWTYWKKSQSLPPMAL